MYGAACSTTTRFARHGAVAANDWVYYRGGPKDGQILLGEHDHDGYLLFDGPGPWAYYRLTGETKATNRGPIPIAEYVGEHPPAKEG